MQNVWTRKDSLSIYSHLLHFSGRHMDDMRWLWNVIYAGVWLCGMDSRNISHKVDVFFTRDKNKHCNLAEGASLLQHKLEWCMWPRVHFTVHTVEQLNLELTGFIRFWEGIGLGFEFSWSWLHILHFSCMAWLTSDFLFWGVCGMKMLLARNLRIQNKQTRKNLFKQTLLHKYNGYSWVGTRACHRRMYCWHVTGLQRLCLRGPLHYETPALGKEGLFLPYYHSLHFWLQFSLAYISFV